MTDNPIAKVLIVGVADVTNINNDLESAGYGPDFFSVPLCDVTKPQDVVTHYACGISLGEAQERGIGPILVRYGVTTSTKKFRQAVAFAGIRAPNKKVKEGFKHDVKKQK